MHMEVQMIPKLNTTEPDRSLHDRPAAYVIAQQYSSATFVSQRFHSRNGKSGEHLKNVMISVFFFYFV